MSVRRTATLMALLATASTAVGCGNAGNDTTKDFKGSQAEAADAVAKLSASMQKGDAAVICRSLLSPATVAAIRKSQGRSCEKALPTLLGPSDNKLVVKDVTVTGNTAVVTVTLDSSQKGADNKESQLRLKQYQGAWKLDQF